MSGQPVRAAVYARVSGKGQKDNLSFDPEGQERDCREFIAARGWELDEERHVYREVFSGAYMDRPELDRLREAIARKEIDRVVVWRFDRFGRDADERVYLRVEAKRSGVLYVSATEQLEDTPEGRLVDYISAYAAGWERQAFAMRAEAAIRVRLRSGKRYPGCKPAYGYRWADAATGEKGALAVYEPEAAIVRRIFAAIAEGRSIRGVTAELNRDNIPTPNPARAKPGRTPIWHVRTIHAIVHNPAYKGLAVAQRRQAAPPLTGGERKTSTRTRPEEEWIVLPCETTPAIVDAAVWDRAHRRLAANKARSERSAEPKRDALLRSYVRCGVCGGAMHVNRNARGTRYRCMNRMRNPACQGHSITAHLLDKPVWQAVEAIFTNPGVIKKKLRREAGATQATAAELAGVCAAVAELDRQETNLTDAIAAATTPAAVRALTARLDALADQRRALKRQEADAQLRLWAKQAALMQADAVEQWCAQERRELARLDYAGKRERFERLDLKVHAFPPGRFEGRFDIAIEPEGITLRDLLDGQKLETAFPTTRSGATASDTSWGWGCISRTGRSAPPRIWPTSTTGSSS